jgi:hypothetical protein
MTGSDIAARNHLSAPDFVSRRAMDCRISRRNQVSDLHHRYNDDKSRVAEA